MIYRWNEELLTTLLDPVRLEPKLHANILEIVPSFGLIKMKAQIRQIMAHTSIRNAYFKMKGEPLIPRAKLYKCSFDF